MDKEEAAVAEEHPKPPIAGVIYGTICYWIVMAGIAVAIVGMIVYFTSDGYVAKECLLEMLWAGEEVEAIWQECAGAEEIPGGHWYLGVLSKGDGIAMLGIAITAVAAVFGMWGALWGTVRSGERLFAVFALIVAVILTASAIGLVSLH
jgi:hypothetical protein